MLKEKTVLVKVSSYTKSHGMYLKSIGIGGVSLTDKVSDAMSVDGKDIEIIEQLIGEDDPAYIKKTITYVEE